MSRNLACTRMSSSKSVGAGIFSFKVRFNSKLVGEILGEWGGGLPVTIQLTRATRKQDRGSSAAADMFP